MTERDDASHRRSQSALDVLNFFMADVRDGLGPFLGTFLASRHWDQGRIGVALSAMTFAQVAAQTPAGAWIDRTRHKRAAIVGAALVIALGAVAMVQMPTFPVVLSAQAVLGAASAVFAPAVAAISLGLVGHRLLARRMGRNEAANHAGNVAAALMAGLIGYRIAPAGVFYLLAAMSVATIACTLMIRGRDIDHDLARGAVEGQGASPHVSKLGELFADRRIPTFILAVTLFHFANAAMLPFVGQKVALGRSARVAMAAMSACIIAAQLVMIPVAVAASRLAESWGRKPVFLIGFAVLPIRGVLYTFSTNPYFLVGVQLLDGIGAGIFGVVGVLVIADLTRGTGRFNLMQGALATATGLGASLSNLMTGLVVKAAGFDVGFLVLSAIAAAALAFFWLAMPETQPSPSRAPAAPAEGPAQPVPSGA